MAGGAPRRRAPSDDRRTSMRGFRIRVWCVAAVGGVRAAGRRGGGWDTVTSLARRLQRYGTPVRWHTHSQGLFLGSCGWFDGYRKCFDGGCGVLVVVGYFRGCRSWAGATGVGGTSDGVGQPAGAVGASLVSDSGGWWLPGGSDDPQVR
ncbi:hypothetical protein Dimus_013886 [Dionaea muscipula]